MKTSLYALIDYSTLDTAALERLGKKVENLTNHKRVGQSLGRGCHGDPPGYPTYLLQGAEGHWGINKSQAVIRNPADGEFYALHWGFDDKGQAERERIMKALWRPLPLDHPRTQAWLRKVLRDKGSRFLDPDSPAPSYGDRFFFREGKDFRSPKTRDDRRVSAATYDAYDEAIERYNADLRAYYAARRTPENWAFTLAVREFYPDFDPSPWLAYMADPDLIDAMPREGDWWETLSERPTPETCPGKFRHAGVLGDNRHNADGMCWVCGYDSTPAPIAP